MAKFLRHLERTIVANGISARAWIIFYLSTNLNEKLGEISTTGLILTNYSGASKLLKHLAGTPVVIGGDANKKVELFVENGWQRLKGWIMDH